MRFIICYDVSDDKRRNKLSKLLKAFGIRTQFSVFEVEAPKEVILKLLEEAEEILDEIDKIFAYPIDDKNIKNIQRLGLSTQTDLVNYI
ncbi:MAG: CRISPR-associated endonuclease Cas2 [Aquificae bacterium]|nr:CRISPR-associated endonuclease Cas2 [Aquificota bacterium]